jgi:hypothetical protein
MVAAVASPTLRRPVRRLGTVLALVFCAAVAAGCGEEEAAGPLDEALGYLPADAPFAVAIDTNLDGDQYRALDRIARKFEFGGQAKDALKEALEDEEGVDFDRDIRPLLGNPFVVGGADPAKVGDDEDDFVGAIQVKDEGKLDDLQSRSKAREAGERGGATIYREPDGDTYAVDEDVLVVASSRRLLDSALDTREEGNGFSADGFDDALEGLPDAALVRAYFDVEALLDADPDARRAQRVKWVDGLRTLGATGIASQDDLEVEFRLRTEGLTEEDLPIAPGDDSPGVVERPGQVAVGIRDLSRVIEFAEAAGRAVDPDGFGDYESAKEQLKALLDLDIDKDLIAQLEGDTAVTVAPDRTFAARAELEDPAAFERTLAKVAKVLPSAAGGLGAGELGIAEPGPGRDLYRLTDSDGRNWFFGVLDDVFVLSRSPAAAKRLASAAPEQVAGARGSVAMSADAQELADAALSGFGALLGLSEGRPGSLTEPLGASTGWVEASPDELHGSVTLGID